MGGASGDIIPFYRRALEQGENLRIEKKITLFESLSLNEETGTGAPLNPPSESGSGVNSSGTMSREAKKQELKQLQEDRNGAVNFSAPMPGDAQREIQGVWNILGGGEERRDW